MTTRLRFASVATLVVAGCGQTIADGPPAGADATPDSANRRGVDATAGGDSGRNDAARADASKDSGRADAGASDARAHPVTDATSDARGTDAAAKDGATPVCDHTGAATGTVVSVITGSAGTLVDFDVDCAGVVYVESSGAVLSCPVTGCVGGPVVIAPAGTAALAARIAPSGLFIFADPLPDGGGRPPFDIFGSGRTPSASLTPVSSVDLVGSESISGDGVAGAQPFYFVHSSGGGGSGTTLTVVSPGTGGSAATLSTYGAGGAGGSGATTCATAIDGAVYFAACLTQTSTTQSSRITRTNLVGASDGETDYFSPTAPVAFNQIAASDLFAVWNVSPDGDGGASGNYACAAGASCAGPVRVTGIDGWTFAGTRHDTLFLVDTARDLATCTVSELLAGACTPTPLATGLAKWSRFLADDDNVYLLLADGTAVLRVAR